MSGKATWLLLQLLLASPRMASVSMPRASSAGDAEDGRCSARGAPRAGVWCHGAAPLPAVR
jgi:hypothetical protein